jgi:hypothetical protein
MPKMPKMVVSLRSVFIRLVFCACTIDKSVNKNKSASEGCFL